VSGNVPVEKDDYLLKSTRLIHPIFYLILSTYTYFKSHLVASNEFVGYIPTVTAPQKTAARSEMNHSGELKPIIATAL
jgi:hypothetical protein